MTTARASRPSGLVTVLLVAMLLLSALALSACGGTKESPGGPSGTGAPAAAATTVVAQDGRTVVMGALNAAGITGDQAYIYMNYTSEAKDEILVQGSMKNKDGGPVGQAVVKNEGGTWKVISSK